MIISTLGMVIFAAAFAEWGAKLLVPKNMVWFSII